MKSCLDRIPDLDIGQEQKYRFIMLPSCHEPPNQSSPGRVTQLLAVTRTTKNDKHLKTAARETG